MLIGNFKTRKEWTTHMMMLIKTVMLTDKPVLELGGGVYSTPLLHWLCKMRGLKLYTYDDHPTYFHFEKKFQSGNHIVHYIENEDWSVVKADRDYGVVFIDHSPSKQRGIDAIKFKDNADYVILHDTEEEEEYGYTAVYPHFKYRYDWKECKGWTTVLSNKIDLSNFNYKL